MSGVAKMSRNCADVNWEEGVVVTEGQQLIVLGLEEGSVREGFPEEVTFAASGKRE